MTDISFRTEHLVDAELRPILRLLPVVDPSVRPLAEIRAVKRAARQPLSGQYDVVAAEHWIERPGGAPMRVLTYRPRSDAIVPAMLHMHGGGYVMGAAIDSAARNERIAAQAECMVASVDYRLAPEANAGEILNDCRIAFDWLVSYSDKLGIDPARIAVGGQSAGGGLAAALALRLRDRGAVQPVFQWLIYPMIDDRTGGGGDEPSYAGEFMWPASANRFCWEAYLGRPPGRDDVSCYEAPARALDLAGLPPCYVAVGALDLFLDENVDYARRLAHAGVPVELHVYPGAFHGFDVLAATGLGENFTRDAIQALRRALRATEGASS